MFWVFRWLLVKSNICTKTSYYLMVKWKENFKIGRHRGRCHNHQKRWLIWYMVSRCYHNSFKLYRSEPKSSKKILKNLKMERPRRESTHHSTLCNCKTAYQPLGPCLTFSIRDHDVQHNWGCHHENLLKMDISLARNLKKTLLKCCNLLRSCLELLDWC